MLSLCFQEVALAENKAAYAREALERRRLHNVVQELRGNIRWAHTSSLHSTMTALLHMLHMRLRSE